MHPRHQSTMRPHRKRIFQRRKTMSKQQNHKKALRVFALVSLLGLLALVFPFATRETATGLVSSNQHLRSIPYPPLYEQQQPSPYGIITTNDPCKAVQCGTSKHQAHPLLNNYGTILKDEYGNVWCKCDGQAELYYRISPTRKY